MAAYEEEREQWLATHNSIRVLRVKEVMGARTPIDVDAASEAIRYPLGSLRALWQADIDLTDVRVPAENRLPGANSFTDAAKVLKATRASCAWSALGHAVAGYDAALNYAAQRSQFGKPLARFQIVQEKLVRMLGGTRFSTRPTHRPSGYLDLQADSRRHGPQSPGRAPTA